MITKKSGVFLATCNCLQSLPASGSKSSTSSLPKHHRSTRPAQCFAQSSRPYATIANDAESSHNEDSRSANAEHVWPQPPNGQSQPTPYQIFSLKQGAPYSKARFYELVKIYHPDINSLSNNNSSSRSSNSSSQISHALKVERYRLIVAAHAILSDPAKRSAYDRFGAGWNGRADIGTWQKGSSSPSQHAPGPFTHTGADPSDPIWRNATWEDWERFYARRAQENGSAEYPPRRAPVYMANSYFLACIVALAIVGSSLNYGRAQDAGTYFVEQRDIVHDKAAKELRRVRQEKSSLSSREDRIEFFVRQREATMGLYSGDIEALRDERADRLLPDKQLCASEELREKDD